MARLVTVVAALGVCLASQAAWALDPYAGNDPHWILIHEPVVYRELKLSRVQAGALQKND